MKTIYIIGDSFVTEPMHLASYKREYHWINKIREYKTDSIVWVDGESSRDAQTIIDHWIKLIPKLKEDDFVIICLPYFSRTRLPLAENHWQNKFPFEDTKIINRFIGTKSCNKNFDVEFFGRRDRDTYVELFMSQEIVNSSEVSKLNYVEVIESLKKITPCESFIYTWDILETESGIIKDRTYLTDKMGGWETLNDVYHKTMGKDGQLYDDHWSYDTFSRFFNFLKAEVL